MSLIPLRLAAALVLLPASAQATIMRRPFAVGGGEGGGAYDGVTGWLLNMQSSLTHAMARDLHAGAYGALIAGGFVYGVAHAAGPGHGKAVIASYMMANDRQLRRGIVLALLAALLQGAVAVALVGLAALAFGATAARMNAVADLLAEASYLGVAAIGAWLVWKKGIAFTRAARAYAARRAALAGGYLFAGAPWGASQALAQGGFQTSAGEAAVAREADDCGHVHAPDPRQLGDSFSWRGAMAAVVAAGARPCSGALLILVFALAQGLFSVGVAAVFAMSLGTAITTGALAWAAVFAKGVAVRFAAGEDTRAALVARACEFAAALAVMTFGLALFFAANGTG
jgi:nickel/cobalt exporter